jgi:teichuronic acid biosynthesis glycosyltransferase TuaG
MLVIDDCSTDKTREVVRRTASDDERITLLTLDENSAKPAVPRNHGIRRARGEYIAFLDADDTWLPTKLEKQVELMEAEKRTGLSYVLFSKMTDHKTSTGTYPSPGLRLKGWIFDRLYLYNFIPNSGVMVRKKVFKSCGMLDEDPRLVYVEDADMWLRIARRWPVDFVRDDILMRYRTKETSLVSKIQYVRARGRFYIAKKHAADAGMARYVTKLLSLPLNESIMAKLLLRKITSY